MYTLTPEQMECFRRDGFVLLKGWYGPAEVKNLSRAVDRLAQEAPLPGRQMVYLEDDRLKGSGRILSRIEKFVEYDDVIRAFACGPKMVGPLTDLLGEPPVLFKDKINFKMPGGDGFKPHQDIQPGWDDYAPYFISVLITIDPSTAENGCLELSAGHHTRGWIGERWKPLEGGQLKGIEFRKYPMAPGDVAFFDCFTPHQSAPNLTDKPRRNLYLTFNRRTDGDHRERYFADKRKSYPPDNEREPGRVYTFRV